MAIPTVQIQGKVVTPDGDPVASGRIEVSLSQAGSALDGASSVRLAPGASAPGSLITLGTGGVLPASAVLVPNDAITPSGTYYRARFVVVPADSSLPVEWTEKWQLASTPNPLDIGAVPRIEGTPAAAYSVTAAVAQAIVDSAIAALTLPVYTLATRPDPGAPWARRFITVQDSGSDMELHFCRLKADGSYEWIVAAW